MTFASEVRLSEIVGRGYADFWHFRGRYRVVKGGRASKKSTTAALWFIHQMMRHPGANTLVVRKTYQAHKDSTYAQLKWAVRRLGVDHLWQFRLSPLELVYLPTGQRILFRGLDDPLSIASITVATGFLCWVWIEEAYQVTDEADFDKLDLSIRGDTGDLWKQFTLTFNPWNEHHWLNKRFFQHESPDTLAMTTTYLQNEFLGRDDLAVFEQIKDRNPRRYRIEGLGEWGIAEGAVFDNWETREFDWREIAQRETAVGCFGLDFGYTVDPTAFSAMIADRAAHEIYVYDEIYKHGLTNPALAALIEHKGFAKERITADSAEPKSIAELKAGGKDYPAIRRIEPAAKGADSVDHGIQRLQQYRIIVHPKCEHTVIELENYTWRKDKAGNTLDEPADEFNHLIDAMRYGTERLTQAAGDPWTEWLIGEAHALQDVDDNESPDGRRVRGTA